MPSGSPPDLPGVSHEWVDAGGLRTHVALAGSPDAPPLVLLHGWPQNWWSWREVIPALSERYRVITPDLRGHGWSEHPTTTRTGWEKAQLVRDHLALLDALGLERVTWIGHDWGAWVGFLLALRAPERIDRMLTLGIPHPWTAPSLRLMAVFAAYQWPISLPWVGPRIADWEARRILQIGRGRGGRLSREEVDGFADTIPPTTTVGMYRTFVTREMLPQLRGRKALGTLLVPTTLIVGARDAVCSTIGPGPVPGQPQLRVERLDGVAHWIPEQRPQAIIDWALDER